MNNNMIGGIVRHLITVIAGAVIVGGNASLEDAITNLMKNIASGDVNAIVASSVIIIAVLWSMWVKATEVTKQNVVKTLTFGKVRR